MSKRNTMTDLEQTFEKAIECDDKYIVIFVECEGCEAPEMIINRRPNFEYKLDYYKKTYGDDLVHKFAKDIAIKSFISVGSMKELANIMEGKRHIQTLEMDLKVNGINIFKDDLEHIELTLDRIINKYEYVQEKVTKDCEVQ
ncbi:MAG: hypothetical protein ACRCWM_10910 [Sarcina sp.]